MSALVLCTLTSFPAGTRISSSEPSVFRLRRGMMTRIEVCFEPPSTASRSVPSPRVPVMRISGRSHPITRTVPATLTTSTCPVAAEGMVWFTEV
jgi:hypothetical protein